MSRDNQFEEDHMNNYAENDVPDASYDPDFDGQGEEDQGDSPFEKPKKDNKNLMYMIIGGVLICGVAYQLLFVQSEPTPQPTQMMPAVQPAPPVETAAPPVTVDTVGVNAYDDLNENTGGDGLLNDQAEISPDPIPLDATANPETKVEKVDAVTVINSANKPVFPERQMISNNKAKVPDRLTIAEAKLKQIEEALESFGYNFSEFDISNPSSDSTYIAPNSSNNTNDKPKTYSKKVTTKPKNKSSQAKNKKLKQSEIDRILALSKDEKYINMPDAAQPIKEKVNTASDIINKPSSSVNNTDSLQKSMTVYAIVMGNPSRAWIRDNAGHSYTVIEGETIPGYGKVININADLSSVTTSSGVLH